MLPSSRRGLAALAGAVTAGALAPRPSVAQEWPTRPLRLLVPFGAGGGMDMVARLIAPFVSQTLGQPVVVENKPGATGTLCMAEVARAQPDGYTMMITGSSYCIVSLLMPGLPFRMTDFSPLTRLTAGPTVLVAPSTLGVRTLAEFIAAAKARPGEWSYGSVGVGTSLHLGGEMLKLRAGIDLVHVPYHGWPNASTDLIAGRTQMYFATVSDALPLITSGRLTALAVSHTERLQALPEVPIFAEVGFPGLRCTTDFGMSIGAAVPAPIRIRLEEAFRNAIRRPEIRERLLANGAFVVGSTAEEAATVIAEDTARYAEVIRAANIRLE